MILTVACQTQGCPQQGRPCPVAYPQVGPSVVMAGPLLCTGCGKETKRVEGQ